MTRSGVRYRQEESSMSEGGESVDLAHMMKALLEDAVHKAESDKNVNVAKLTEDDAIEAHLWMAHGCVRGEEG